jgi:exocyst complex component 5
VFRDLKSYQDAAESFSLPALHERFEFLRELGNLFLVRPEVLKAYITENALGRIDTTLLKPFLVQRADWSQVEKVFTDFGLPNGDGGDDTTAPGSAKGTGFRDRFGGRLSMMIKDLDLDRMRIGENMPALPSGLGGFSNRMSGIQVPVTLSSGMSAAGARMSAFAGTYSWSNGAFGNGQRTSDGPS